MSRRRRKKIIVHIKLTTNFDEIAGTIWLCIDSRRIQFIRLISLLWKMGESILALLCEGVWYGFFFSSEVNNLLCFKIFIGWNFAQNLYIVNICYFFRIEQASRQFRMSRFWYRTQIKKINFSNQIFQAKLIASHFTKL